MPSRVPSIRPRPASGGVRAFFAHPLTVTTAVAFYVLLIHVFFVLYLADEFIVATSAFGAEALMVFGVAGAVGVLWSRKNKELEDRNAHLHSIVQGLPEPVVLVDPAGTVVDANEALHVWAGTSAVVGRPFGDVLRLDGATRPIFDSAVVEAHERGRAAPFELELASATGRRDILVDTIRLGPPGGRVQAMLIVHDVTEERRTRRLLEEQQAMLIEAEKLASLGTLVAGVAHEINNPLGAMRANTELALMNLDMLSKPGPDEAATQTIEEIREFIRANLRGIDRIHATTRALKEVSRRRPGEVVLLDLNEAVREVVEVLRPLLTGRASVLFDLDPALARVACAPHEIHQVLLNLVKNAAEAVEPLGEAGRIGIRTRDEGERVLVAVEDNGPGVEPELRHRVFDAFFTTKEGGTGLGLAISVNVARNHGGSLVVEDAPGRGARFVLRLPHADPGADALPGTPSASPSSVSTSVRPKEASA